MTPADFLLQLLGAGVAPADAAAQTNAHFGLGIGTEAVYYPEIPAIGLPEVYISLDDGVWTLHVRVPEGDYEPGPLALLHLPGIGDEAAAAALAPLAAQFSSDVRAIAPSLDEAHGVMTAESGVDAGGILDAYHGDFVGAAQSASEDVDTTDLTDAINGYASVRDQIADLGVSLPAEARDSAPVSIDRGPEGASIDSGDGGEAPII